MSPTSLTHCSPRYVNMDPRPHEYADEGWGLPTWNPRRELWAGAETGRGGLGGTSSLGGGFPVTCLDLAPVPVHLNRGGRGFLFLSIQILGVGLPVSLRPHSMWTGLPVCHFLFLIIPIPGFGTSCPSLPDPAVTPPITSP